jgi:signal transduction histidine kinase
MAKFQPGEPVVIIEVEDTGAGIPLDKLPRVFEPFFTTKASGIGTGLGLPVSKQIIDLHGGAIQLAPGERGGARATITLKAAQE